MKFLEPWTDKTTVCRGENYGLYITNNCEAPCFTYVEQANIKPEADNVVKVSNKNIYEILSQPSKRFNGYSNWQVFKFIWNSEHLDVDINFNKYFEGYYDDLYKDIKGYLPSTVELKDTNCIQKSKAELYICEASFMNKISNNKVFVENPYDFGEDYKSLNDNDTLIYDTNNEIFESAIGGLFEIYKGINISNYKNNLDWFLSYYTTRGFRVIVDSEIDNNDTIYYITISWEDKENE